MNQNKIFTALKTPYTDISVLDDSFVRIFSEDVDSSELIWHRDKKDREVTVCGSDENLEKNFWQIQFDNELPVDLIVGEVYNIPKEQFHRVIKGSGDLQVIIREHG